MRQAFASLILSSLCLLAAGCDQLGIESATAIAARKEADGKAIGGACRHAGRAIEDCYVLNRKADRAAVYAGWREMNEYMRENKLEVVPPQIDPERLAAAKPGAEVAEPSAEAKRAEKADKGSEKSAEKGAEKSEPAAPRHRRPAP
jgi:hypothetical protein